MTAEELLENEGYEDVLIFKDFSYDTALIGVTTENNAVYDYDKMITYLVEECGFSVDDAVEWIDYNTVRSLGYYGGNTPIIMYRLSNLEDKQCS